jgi:copper chaperone
MQFQIDSMVCGGCVRSVTKAIQGVDPAAEVSADPATHLVAVKTGAAREAIVAALVKAGYEPA